MRLNTARCGCGAIIELPHVKARPGPCPACAAARAAHASAVRQNETPVWTPACLAEGSYLAANGWRGFESSERGLFRVEKSGIGFESPTGEAVTHLAKQADKAVAGFVAFFVMLAIRAKTRTVRPGPCAVHPGSYDDLLNKDLAEKICDELEWAGVRGSVVEIGRMLAGKGLRCQVTCPRRPDVAAAGKIRSIVATNMSGYLVITDYGGMHV
jgi:hypothetical protein